MLHVAQGEIDDVENVQVVSYHRDIPFTHPFFEESARVLHAFGKLGGVPVEKKQRPFGGGRFRPSSAPRGTRQSSKIRFCRNHSDRDSFNIVAAITFPANAWWVLADWAVPLFPVSLERARLNPLRIRAPVGGFFSEHIRECCADVRVIHRARRRV